MKGFGTKQAPDGGSDLSSIPGKVADEVRRTVDSAYEDVSRNIRRARQAAEDVIDESRYGIKRNPFAAVGTAALAGLIAGLAIGWCAGYSSRRK